MLKPTICALLIGALVTLAGCGSTAITSSPSPLTTSGENGDSGPVSLTLWTQLTIAAQADALTQQAEECAASLDQDVAITVESVSGDTIYQRLLTSFENDEGPNIINSTEGKTGFAQAAGFLVPVDDVIDEIGRDDFVPSYLRAVSKDDQTWAVPDWALHSEIWYRTDVFEEKGIAVPTSWPELLAAAQAVDEGPDGMRGFAVPMYRALVAGQQLAPILYSAGVYIRDPETGEYVFGDNLDQAAEALQLLVDLYETSPPDALNWNFGDFRNSFVQGQVAMIQDFGAVVQMAAADNPDLLDKISAFPVPPPTTEMTSGGSFGGGYFFLIGKSTPTEEEASKAIVRCLASTENVVERANTRPVFALPARIEARSDPAYTENELVQLFSDEIAMLEDQVLPTWYRYGMENGLSKLTGQIEAATFFGDEMQAAALGTATADEAVARIDQQLQTLLAFSE